MPAYTIGTKVRRKSDGTLGTVVAVTEREVIVKYEPTNRTERTPWGPWTDTTGTEGHHFHAYAERTLEVVV